MAKISLTQGGRTVNGKQQTYNKETGKYQDIIAFQPPAARGDDFAENLNEGAAADGTTAENLVNEFGSVTGAAERSYGYSPTVLSNANKVERVIPLLNSQASNLSAGLGANDSSNFSNVDDAGGVSGEDATETFDEVLGIKKKKKEEDELDFVTKKALGELEKMRRMSRTGMNQEINEIENQFQQRKLEQQQINERNQQRVAQSLNLGGSSRYAPVSSANIMSLKESQGVQALANLDAKESQLISEIRSAQRSQDFELMEKKFNLLETVRAERAETTSKLNEEMRLNSAKITKQNAIVDLFQQGVEDPAEIYDLLNRAENGDLIGDVSLEDIAATLKIINPPENLAGLTADFKTYQYLKKIGDPSVEGLDYMQYVKAVENAKRKSTAGGGGSSSGGGDYSTEYTDFDYFGEKMADVKDRVMEIFPGEFGRQILLELTDEQVRLFLQDFENAQIDQQMNLDPEEFFLQWSEQFLAKEEKSSSSMADRINALLGE